MTTIYPLNSLKEGHWFKLICGASFQHLPAIRNLSLAYTLAGADCIDVAADPAVIAVAREAIETAAQLRRLFTGLPSESQGSPWLMVSLNDGEDPHFRKAVFDPQSCPADCSRPCERVCPTQAIVFHTTASQSAGVIDQRCYGCGRCIPICPIQQISTRSYVSAPEVVVAEVLPLVDAIEIHTQVGRFEEFARLWRAIGPGLSHLKLVAVSCPDGPGLIDYLQTLYALMSPLPCALIWQTDGRPMSGDIGDGATRAAIRLGQKVLSAQLPGYVQLAGGTNAHTVAKLDSLGLLKRAHPTHLPEQRDAVPGYIAGVAYGSYARALLSPVLDQLEPLPLAPIAAGMLGARQAEWERSLQPVPLEAEPELLRQAVTLACSLVHPLKFPADLQTPLCS